MTVPRVVAVHFPKAGGTSLKQQFAAVLKSQLVTDYAADPLESRCFKRQFPRGKSMVFGHFHPARYDGAEAFRMTFLRDPVANLISTYHFWKALRNRGNQVHQRFLLERPTILDFARYEPITLLMSQTFFGGYDMDRFDFIGFDESRSDDLKALSRRLGIPISADIHVNKTDASDAYAAMQTNPKLRGQLTDILSADVAFYERLRNKTTMNLSRTMFSSPIS